MSYARLAVASALTALALLVLVPAPTHSLWELSVAIGERGYTLIPVALLVAFAGTRRCILSRAATALALFDAVILLLPLAQASAIASGLDARVDSAFGTPGVAVPGSGALSLRSLVMSAGVGGPPPITLRYAAGDSSAISTGDSLALDFYRANRPGSAPLILTVHGGSWQSGDRTDLPELNSYLARLGYAVAAVSYRFAPAHPFPAALDDVRSALRYLRVHSREMAIDTTRVVLIGRSAGGQIALLAAYAARDPAIKGAIGLYAPADLTWGYNHPSNPRVLNSTAALEDYLGGSPSSAAQRYEAASPFTFAATTRVPTLLVHGTRDELVSVVQSRRLDRRLARYGAPHLLLELPWATHGCDYFINGPCGQLETEAVRRFLSIITR